jgi:hypothetical protein
MLQSFVAWVRREAAWVRTQLLGEDPPPLYRVAVGTVVLAVCGSIEEAVAKRADLIRQYPDEPVHILHPLREF